MNKYLLVSISAENKEQADSIMNVLLEKKIITGGQMISAPARFLWKGEVTDMDYWTVNAYTLNKFREEIISEVKKVSVEEVPMISFVSFEGNKELLDWIDQTLE